MPKDTRLSLPDTPGVYRLSLKRGKGSVCGQSVIPVMETSILRERKVRSVLGGKIGFIDLDEGGRTAFSRTGIQSRQAAPV